MSGKKLLTPCGMVTSMVISPLIENTNYRMVENGNEPHFFGVNLQNPLFTLMSFKTLHILTDCVLVTAIALLYDRLKLRKLYLVMLLF